MHTMLDTKPNIEMAKEIIKMTEFFVKNVNNIPGIINTMVAILKKIKGPFLSTKKPSNGQLLLLLLIDKALITVKHCLLFLSVRRKFFPFLL